MRETMSGHTGQMYIRPEEIEKRSMQIIENELRRVSSRSFDEHTAPVVKRVIHTTV